MTSDATTDATDAAHMGFRPRVASNVARMDARLFDPRLMRLAADVLAKPRGYRSARVTAWHAPRDAASN